MRVVLPYKSLTPDQRAAVDAQFGNTLSHALRIPLCPGCKATDSEGRPTACQQGCPLSYASSGQTPYTSTGARKQSKLEKRYMEHLKLRMEAGDVLGYGYEPVWVRLDASTTYTPDFCVLERSGVVLVELKPAGKGGKPYWQPKARVKWKWAGKTLKAAGLPVRLVATWPKGDGWGVEVYGVRRKRA